MDLALRGRTALITGASRGIGAGVAQALAAEGCNLALAARNAQHLRELADALNVAHGVRVDIHASDLAQAGACTALANTFQNVDILVNNAGAIPQGSLADLDETAWRQAWELKLFGCINLSREVFRGMCERGSGVIVNIIGMAGERPAPHYVAGSMANAALMAMTKALGTEGIDKGVRVVGINPGAIETSRQVLRWQARARDQFGDENRWRELTAGYPRGRLGQVDEIASAVAFLASDRSSYTNATILTIDGGWTSMH